MHSRGFTALFGSDVRTQERSWTFPVKPLTGVTVRLNEVALELLNMMALVGPVTVRPGPFAALTEGHAARKSASVRTAPNRAMCAIMLLSKYSNTLNIGRIMYGRE